MAKGNKMTTLQIRISEKEKKQAMEVFDKVGINISTAIRTFIRKSISVGGLPFELNIYEQFGQAIDDCQEVSRENGNYKMSLEEINRIIDETRNKKK